jgi:hypothetical protein
MVFLLGSELGVAGGDYECDTGERTDGTEQIDG